MDTKRCIATARQPNIQTQERATARLLETPSHGASQQGPVLGGHHGRNHGGLVTISCAWTTLYSTYVLSEHIRTRFYRLFLTDN